MRPDRLAIVAVALVAGGLTLNRAPTGRSGNALPSVASAAPTGAPDTPPQPVFDLIRGVDGYWRVGRSADSVWWFVSPDGRAEFLNLVTTVQPFQLPRDPQGIAYVSRDWSGGTSTESGDLDRWASRTLERIRDTGFKGLGAWSNHAFHDHDVPMTRDLNVWAWVPPDSRRLYSPGWKSVVEHAVKTQVVPLRDNRNLVGYFIDNELDWGDGFSGPAHYFNHLAPDDPNRAEVVKVIRSIWTTLDAFNQDWQTQVTDWGELDGWEQLPHVPDAYGRLFSAWLSHLAEDYFRTTCTLIREHDPNHLILGVRFRGYAPREVVRASREWTDAQSINYYVSDGRLDPEMFRMMNEESGQPILIGEYSFHALDGRSGNRNTVGFAAQVLDQQARADGYRLFTSRLARVPYIVGAEWFQWHDEPPSGRSHDGEDVNFGVVDVDDHPYELLSAAVRETGPRLNAIHASSLAESQDADVWRESFSNKPQMTVAYLDRPVRINGELSDWASHSEVPGLRLSQTIGLDRSQLPLPKAHLGWREEGLYLAFEVFDHDIQGTPPNGWWWTRDHVEFWISTRPVKPDQHGYDVHSHQFFFVPIEWPAADGLLGQVGQWHRAGDALEDHLVPHPDLRSAVRIFPDRYVVEIFIPGSALHGFDPQEHPELAFNIHIRNFERATDYFWSAPKEVMTQLHPRTWGTLKLEPAASPPNVAHTDTLPIGE